MKKKILLTSILTIALCLSLIVGSTFALFTSESKVNIAVNAGKVEMIANVENIETWSLENDKTAAGRTDGTFTQGGTATFANGVLTLDKIIPGDKVAFDITGTNNSNVTIQYRVKIACTEGDLLMSALKVTIGNDTVTGLSSYTSAWTTLTAGTAMNTVDVAIELPAEAGNEYQDLTTKISVLVEAVQGNATVTNDEAGTVTLKAAGTATELTTALANGGKVVLADDIDMSTESVVVADNTTLDLGGKDLDVLYLTSAGNTSITNGTLSLPDAGYIYAENGASVSLENVVIESESLSVFAYTGGTLTLKNVDLSTTSTSNPVQNYGGTLILDDVTASQAGDATTAWYSSAVQVINEIVYNSTASKYQVVSQANTIIESGNYTGKKAIMISAPGGNVTVNGGTFVGSEAVIQADFAPQYYLDGSNYESVVTINGGDFTGTVKASAAAKIYINGGNFDGNFDVKTETELVIKGGTFTVDPTDYLADGYVATESNGTWTVTAQ